MILDAYDFLALPVSAGEVLVYMNLLFKICDGCQYILGVFSESVFISWHLKNNYLLLHTLLNEFVFHCMPSCIFLYKEITEGEKIPP